MARRKGLVDTSIKIRTEYWEALKIYSFLTRRTIKDILEEIIQKYVIDNPKIQKIYEMFEEKGIKE